MRSFALAFNILLFTSLASAAGNLCLRGFSTESGFESKRDAQIRLAQEAGLHYINRAEPGYSRQKNDQSAFNYFDAEGHLITDPEVTSRISQLRIPPAWSRVWISPDPLSHIQARGYDQRGRVQSVYHPIWASAVKDATKFDRMSRFGQALPHLRAAVAKDLERPTSEPENRIAAVVRLMESSGIRIGGERYAQENEHYGLTTMLVRHLAELTDSHATFDFVGKEGRSHRVEISDAAVIRTIRSAIQGKQATDPIFDVTDAAVNRYIKNNSSTEFSAKDFRTWGANIAAARVLYERGPPRSDQERVESERLAAIAASEILRNEPNTARDNYIDPYVFESFRNGRLESVFSDQRNRPGGTSEQALLRLLAERNSH